MKYSLNWLKDYIDIKVTPQVLMHKLTMAGLEVEDVHSTNKDKIFELEITPNRADCLNMIGLSRELSAILNKSRKEPKIKKLKYPSKKNDIKIEDKLGCSKYIGTLVEDVKITQSPLWIKKRIESLGLRPISNIVDITNFCLLELGQPLHAFDYDKLEGGKIIVRRAKKGEKIITIDDVERELDPSILVIADAKRPVAIAGVMGGKETEVNDKTKNILLESAYFDPVLIRRASRKLGLSSDSSYRFERGVDYNTVEKGSQRALNLILELAQGKITKHTIVTAGNKQQKSKSITISLEQINGYTGAQLTLAKCKTILTKLDFKVSAQGKGSLKIVAPSFRSDIKEEVDIIEEIARVIGYDNLPMSMPQVQISTIPTSSKRTFRQSLQGNLCSQGLNEVLTFSLINNEMLEKSSELDGLDEKKFVRVTNPLNQDVSLMRPSLLPSFLSIVNFNLNRGQTNLKCFEIGKVYSTQGERETIALVMTGKNNDDWREQKKSNVSYYDLKGIIEQAFQRSGIDKVHFDTKEKKFMELGQSAAVFVDKKEVGVIGKLHEAVLDKWGIKEKNVLFAQLDIEDLAKKAKTKKSFEKITEHPSIVRDVSLAVKKNVRFDQIKKIAADLGSGMINSIEFTEEYLGEKIAQDHRGVVFSLTYQLKDRTLREDEVNTLHQKILDAFVDKLGAIVR